MRKNKNGVDSNFTPGPEKKFLERFNKKIIIFLVFLLLCVGLGFLAFTLLKTDQNKNQGLPASASTVMDTKEKANTKANSGDVDGALVVYDESVFSSTSNEAKSDLLIAKAVFAVDNKKFDVALESAKKAVELDRNGDSLGRLAWTYKKSGDKANAIKYYNEAADYMDKVLNSTDSNGSVSFRKQAKSLGDN